MEPLRCAECEHRIRPDESLVARLGQLFHAACHERRVERFSALAPRRPPGPGEGPRDLRLSA